MVYYIISDSEQHINEITLNLGLQDKTDGKDYFSFNTLKYSFGFIQLVSAIWKHYSEYPDAVFVINAELKFKTDDERANYQGMECARALRMMNKFRNENNIFLTGFSQKCLVEKKTEREFEKYGVVYHQLPLTSEDYSSIKINNSSCKNVAFTELPEYHLIGLLDDHYDDFDRTISVELNNNKEEKAIYQIISYEYSLKKPFIDNFPGIKRWLSFHDVLDQFLLDLNYEIINNNSITEKQDSDMQVTEKLDADKKDTKKQDTDKQGLNVLQYIDSIGYQTPIVILSVSKDVNVIKNITLGYHQHIADFIPVEPITNIHSKRDIKNIDDVVKAITKCLKETGAKRNKLGILVTHGTDTMAWTLSLLQYSLKQLKCNVILTGSQIPLKAEFSPSDAPANIIAALHYLNQFVPSQIGVSFDMGKKLLSNNLKKVRIWNENAFDGHINAQFNWQDIETNHKTLSFNNCLDKLLLLTTGGTIAMTSSHGSTGRPDSSAMEKFLDSSAAQYRVPDTKRFQFYKSIRSKSIANIDSSEMNPNIYGKILETFSELNKEYDFAEKVETDFRWDVYPIQCSPFMREEDYDIYTKHYKTKDDKGNETITNNKPIVYILLGYGAGNLPYKSNQDENEKGKEHYSPMNFVREVIKDGNIVVLTSHVQQEIPDLDYDVSVKYIEEGVLFGGDMPLAEIMIKCAYLLGNVSTKEPDDLRFLKTSIMAGVGFRGKTSRIKYINLLRNLLDVVDERRN